MQQDERVTRHTFTLLASDIERIQKIKKKCLVLGLETHKSELLRAGLIALTELADQELINLLSTLPKIKTGRKKKNSKKLESVLVV